MNTTVIVLLVISASLLSIGLSLTVSMVMGWMTRKDDRFKEYNGWRGEADGE